MIDPPVPDSKFSGTAGDETLGAALLTELRSQSRSDREVFGSLQQELRRIARAKMRFERPEHTLQPTALVNEAFLKLVRSHLPVDFWSDPTRVLRFVAHAMEQILNDHADAHSASKRGGARKQRVPIDDQQARELGETQPVMPHDSALLVQPEQSENILGIRDALRLLRQTSPRQAQVVQLQFYGGLTQDEIAAVLEVSVETVKLDWRKAKAFLKIHLSAIEEK